MTAQITELSAWFQRTTGKPMRGEDPTRFRITVTEELLDNAKLSDAETATHLMARYGQPEQVAKVIAQHAELIKFLPPDAVPSLDEQDEYEALAYELHEAIKKLVSTP